MTKENFLDTVTFLRNWREDIEKISDALGIDDIYEAKFIRFDAVVDRICLNADYGEWIEEAIYDFIWEPDCKTTVEIGVLSCDGIAKNTYMDYTPEQFYDAFLRSMVQH